MGPNSEFKQRIEYLDKSRSDKLGLAFFNAFRRLNLGQEKVAIVKCRLIDSEENIAEPVSDEKIPVDLDRIYSDDYISAYFPELSQDEYWATIGFDGRGWLLVPVRKNDSEKIRTKKPIYSEILHDAKSDPEAAHKRLQEFEKTLRENEIEYHARDGEWAFDKFDKSTLGLDSYYNLQDAMTMAGEITSQFPFISVGNIKFNPLRKPVEKNLPPPARQTLNALILNAFEAGRAYEQFDSYEIRKRALRGEELSGRTKTKARDSKQGASIPDVRWAFEELRKKHRRNPKLAELRDHLGWTEYTNEKGDRTIEGPYEDMSWSTFRSRRDTLVREFKNIPINSA